MNFFIYFDNLIEYSLIIKNPKDDYNALILIKMDIKLIIILILTILFSENIIFYLLRSQKNKEINAKKDHERNKTNQDSITVNITEINQEENKETNIETDKEYIIEINKESNIEINIDTTKKTNIDSNKETNIDTNIDTNQEVNINTNIDITCSEDTPFRCPVNGTVTCVKSQVECDCPQNWIKCNYMKYCVPEDKPWMCPNYKKRNCAKLNNNNPDYILFPDGICRHKDQSQPSQIVCPNGKVLCANLSCVDNHYLCPNSTETPQGFYRCVNQDIKKEANECPSTITCPDKDQVVCYNGNCVKNEILCPPIECPDNKPCDNSVKVDVACGDNYLLCNERFCRNKCT